MTSVPYDSIADWYDAYLRQNPLYEEVILPGMLALVGDSDGQVVCDLACGQGFIARARPTRRAGDGNRPVGEIAGAGPALRGG